MLPILSPSPYSWHRTAFIFRVYHCFVFFSFLNNFFHFLGGFMAVGGKGVGCRGVSVGGDGTLLFELFSRRGGALSPCSRPTSVLHFWDITFLWHFFCKQKFWAAVSGGHVSAVNAICLGYEKAGTGWKAAAICCQFWPPCSFNRVGLSSVAT